MKAIFLDRDGVIIDNSAHYYIFKTEDVKFIDGIIENLLRLQSKDYHLFVVTNQGGVSKNHYKKEDVEKVHDYIENEFGKHGIKIKEFSYCPHHDSVEKCFCRKPSSLMIERLISKHKIDRANSFLIGDSIRDIEAANGAGVRGILIPPNQNLQPIIAEMIP